MGGAVSVDRAIGIEAQKPIASIAASRNRRRDGLELSMAEKFFGTIAFE
jgi:hypothetical protein